MSRRIGILGGTFDPIHTGHLDVAAAAEDSLGLSRMLIVPANVPPHRPQPIASAFHRFAMVALAVAGHRGWRASDVELRASEQPSYTTATLQSFHDEGFGAAELFFVIGADAFAEIATWKDYPNILGRANFAVVSRPGCPVEKLPGLLPQLAARMVRPPLENVQAPVIILIDRPTADVSSTAIRQRCAAGESIEGMVARGVQQHIEQHGLYASTIPGRRAEEGVDTPAAGRLHGKG